jgi:hypothetical protein
MAGCSVASWLDPESIAAIAGPIGSGPAGDRPAEFAQAALLNHVAVLETVAQHEREAEDTADIAGMAVSEDSVELPALPAGDIQESGNNAAVQGLASQPEETPRLPSCRRHCAHSEVGSAQAA